MPFSLCHAQATFRPESDGDGGTRISPVNDSWQGGLEHPSGTTAQRSGSPSKPVTYSNTSTGTLQYFNGSEWIDLGSGGGAPDDATYITQTPDATLSAEQALSALASGLLKNTTATGVLSIAIEGTDYYGPGGTDVAIADGGTAGSTDSAARANLGLEIGVDVQAYDADLASIAALGTAPDKMLYTTGVDTWAETPITAVGRSILDDATAADVRTTIGAGTGSGTITTVGDVTSGAAFDGSAGTVLTWSGDAADTGAIRLRNNDAIAWEASPAGTDVTLSVNASERIVSSATIDITAASQQLIILRNGETDDYAIGIDGDNSIIFETVGGTDLMRIGTGDILSRLDILLIDDKVVGLGQVSGRIQFDDQATDEVNILSANVGINTQTPGSRLHVNGNVQIGGGTSASETRYMEPSGSGTNYTGFKAQAMAANPIYTLPAASGTAGQVLTWNAGDVLTWETDADTQLSQEQVEDFAGAMVSGNTETLIAVTYEDGDGTLDFVVDNDLANYDNSTSAFLQNIVEDTTPQLGGALDGQGNDLNNLGVIFLTEQAAAEADVAGKGQFWVQTLTPNLPMFTDDAGTDFQLATTTDLHSAVTLAGTPDYITLTGQEITRNKLDPADDLNTFASSVLSTLLTDEVAGTGGKSLFGDQTVSTDSNPQFATIELGHATDTTLARGSAGVMTVEGTAVALQSRQLTIAGTANQITSSAGAQDLSADRTWTLSLPADVLIPTVLTVPNTGLHLLDTDASHDLILKPGSNLTADRTLTVTTGDADRALDISAADVTITAAAATVLDDATVAAMVDTLGGAASTGTGGLVRATAPALDQPTVATSLTGTNGITISGSTASGGNMLLQSTTNATKGLVSLGSLTDGVIYDGVNKRLGIGTAAPEVNFHILDQGAAAGIQFDNYNDGGVPLFQFRRALNTLASPNAVTNGKSLGRITSRGHTGTSFLRATEIESLAAATFTASSSPGKIVFRTTPPSSTTPAERMTIGENGNVVVNSAAIATTATNGFLYVPSCAGTPTGTPTTFTGRVPIVVDTTNHKLYFYSGGSWRDAGP